MQLYSLTWNTYSDHLKKSTMVMNEDFSDVILVTEDKKQMFSFNVQLAIYQSLKLLKNASQDKEEVLKVVGVVHSFYHCRQKPLLYLVKLSV